MKKSRKHKKHKKKDSPQYYSFSPEVIAVDAESRRLEREMLILESERLFQEFHQTMMQKKRTRPEDPDCEKTKTE